LYGTASLEQQAVRQAWLEVGIRVKVPEAIRPITPASAKRGLRHEEADSLAALQRQVEQLARAVAQLNKQLMTT
jgi:hypothetical protein